MDEYEFLLEDRIAKIKAINEQYDLEHNAYISFSGGKDSTVLHYLIDMALPKNQIPRLFLNTGIEYQYIVEFVKQLAQNDNRIIIYNSGVNIKQMLEKEGYPFKSKQHSHNLAVYWRNKDKKEYNLSLKRYLGIIESNTLFRCPKQLQYQFTPEFQIKCSDSCCMKMKKEPAKKWQKENNKTIALTGMRKEEGGQRASLKGCIVTDKDNKIVKFHPLLVVNDDFENWFIEKNNIKLCKLYYEPFNFKRTGCKGCPFSLNLQENLDVMERLLPNEKKQCEILWAPVYKEYRRIGYRLRKNDEYKRISIFDFVNQDNENNLLV